MPALLELSHSGILARMSFLFHKKTTKVLTWIWKIIAVLIILSMVALFAPGIFF